MKTAISSGTGRAERLLKLCIAFLMTFACRREPDPTSVPAPAVLSEAEEVTIEWAGCTGVRKGPICELGAEHKLTVWVSGPNRPEWRLSTDRGRPSTRIEPAVEGGTRLTITMDPNSRRLGILDEGGRTQWELALSKPAHHEEVDRLLELGRSGDYEKALAQLEDLRLRAPAVEGGQADAAIARMALALGKVGRAETAFRASITAAKREGRIHDVVKDGAGLLWALVHLEQRYGEARTLLEDMTPYGMAYPEGRVWLDYHAGLLASDTADVRTALAKYRSAQRRASRLGLVDLKESSADEVARVLTRIGKASEAVTIARELPSPSEPCARATRALNLGEALMERSEYLQSPVREPEVTEALAAARKAALTCPDPHRRLLALTYSAEYALQVRDDTEAGQWIRRLRADPEDRDVLRSSRRDDVLGRWLLHLGKPDLALACFQREILAARATGLLEESFRGEVGAGRSLLAMGERDPATAHLRNALAAMETMLSGIPLTEGRGSFLGGHEEATRYLVAALVEGGAIDQAVRAARWARSIELAHATSFDRLANLSKEARVGWETALGQYRRIRAALEREAEEDWTVPRGQLVLLRAARQVRAEQARAALEEAYRLLSQGQATQSELSRPKAGEVYIVLFPGPKDWYAFGVTDKGASAHRVSADVFSASSGPKELLALFGRQLATAQRIRFFPYGNANQIDWQSVSWRGSPLLEAAEVEYALDVGARETSDLALEPSLALVVSNPGGDLPAAEVEGKVVANRLRGWEVMRLDGPVATRSATLTGLSRARLFHFAGHADVSGADRLSSALVASTGAKIELGDLLTVARVPEVVVLSACEAAATPKGQPSMMGLAQTFIAAGSRIAIASTRPIRDEQAQELLAQFYSFLAAGSARESRGRANIGTQELVEVVRVAFRNAMLSPISPPHSTIRGGPRTDSQVRDQSFRLFVP